MSANELANGSPLIIALDYADARSALDMAERLNPEQCRVKVGKELFTRCGPDIVENLQKLGFDVFLDLKFHDIPNTTAAAVRAAADLGVWMVNVHAAGGRRMMEACRETLSSFSYPPLLIAVTVLTSMESSDLAETGIDVSPLRQVKRLAGLAKKSGMDGIVCSSREVVELKAELGREFKMITPGIRPAASSQDDQKRVMTPVEAIKAGSDYLVIGRPVTQARDPQAALTAIFAELGSE